MKLALLLTAVLLVLPSAFAFNCNMLNVSQQELCNQISVSNYTADEKEALITLLIYTDREKPNHDFVSFWNQQLNPTSAPQNVQVTNQGTIKNAWMRIFGIMPSVLEDSTLYCSSSGTLQVGYNYSYQLPTGKASGDCRTDYFFSKDRTKLTNYLNGATISTSKLSSFNTLEQNNQFSSTLDILLDTKVNHYKNVRYCCKYRNGYCRSYCDRCDFSSTEIKTDELILKDNLNAKLYNSTPSGSVKSEDLYKENIKGRVDYQNITYLSLNIGNSSYEKSSYVYDFNYSFLPYNFITLTATPFNKEKTNGIIKQSSNSTGFTFISPSSDNCTITFADHFQSSARVCILETNSLNISIKTDKFYYFDNETINISIIPGDIALNISYGNESFIAKGNTSLKAVYPINKISAFYNDHQIDIFISVINQSRWAVAWNLFIFFLILYLLYKIITKNRRLSKWLTAD